AEPARSAHHEVVAEDDALALSVRAAADAATRSARCGGLLSPRSHLHPHRRLSGRGRTVGALITGGGVVLGERAPVAVLPVAAIARVNRIAKPTLVVVVELSPVFLDHL